MTTNMGDRMNPSDRAVDWLRVLGDIVLVVLGALVLIATPDSLREFGLREPGATVWAAAVVVGASAALVAGFTQHLLAEVWSCLLVIAGLLFWVIALAWPEETSIIKVAVALGIARGIIGECVRIADAIGERQATR